MTRITVLAFSWFLDFLHALGLETGNRTPATFTSSPSVAIAGSHSYLLLARPIGGQTFAYDAYGNITKTANGIGLSFTNGPYDGGLNNHMNGLGYDGMGNVTQDNLGNSYTYDAEGRAVSAAGVTVTLDVFGRVVAEQGNKGNPTWGSLVYSPTGWKFALMNGTSLVKYRDPMPGGLVATHNGDGTGYYQDADWLGSSRMGDAGELTVRYDRAYAPFGEVYAELNGDTENRTFTGPQEDTTPGIDDFLMRQYSASQGRWLVPDPAGLGAVDITNPQTWNRYAYVMNNPLSHVDPLGLHLVCGDPDPYSADNTCDGGGGGGSGGGGGGGGYGGGSATGITAGPCGMYCAPPLTLIGEVGTLSLGTVIPQWYIDQVTQGQANLANPGAPPVDPTAETIWVYCGGTVSGGILTSVGCGPPSQAVAGSVGYANYGLSLGLDIWHCPGCAATWRNTSGAANAAGWGTLTVVSPAVAAGAIPAVNAATNAGNSLFYILNSATGGWLVQQFTNATWRMGAPGVVGQTLGWGYRQCQKYGPC